MIDRNTTTPKPFVFVLMPFKKALNEVYRLGIKAAAESVGAYAERVDEQHFTDSILDRILNQISKADVIVADMTGKNPNVYYEVGYAHAIGKPVLFITQSIDDIPFDLKHRKHTKYKRSGLGELKAVLAPRIEAAIRQKGFGRWSLTPCPLDISLGGHRLIELGSGEPPKVQILQYDQGSHLLFAPLVFRNARSHSRFQIDEVHLLVGGHSKVAPFAGPQKGEEPIWYHERDREYDNFPKRFLLIAGPHAIAAFGMFKKGFALSVPPGEIFAPVRLELLCEGTVFAYEFTVQNAGAH